MSALRTNIVSLLSVQGVNYLLPLVTVPYLAHVIGAQNFGRIAFAQAFAQYFVIAADFGFSLSATRRVALLRNQPEQLSRLFNAVMAIKLGIMTLGFLFLITVMPFVYALRRDETLCLIAYLSVLGNVFYPVWLFQGLERMNRITVCSISARILSVAAIFIFVHTSQQTNLAAGLQAATSVISAIFALTTITSIIELQLRLPRLGELKELIIDTWPLFLSTASVSLYTSTNIFILGLETNSIIVGYFSGADKLVRAAQGLLTPVSQAFYPHIISAMTRSRRAAFDLLRRLIYIQGAVTAFISLGLIVFAKPIVLLTLGPAFKPATPVVEVMGMLPFIVGLSNALGVQTMLALNMKRHFRNIIVFSGLLNILLLLPLARHFGAVGAASSTLITECTVTFLMAVVLENKGILRAIFCSGLDS